MCSAAKLDLVRSLGADHVVDYTSEDFADGERRYDLILDIAGNPAVAAASCAHARAARSSSSAVSEAATGPGIGRQVRAPCSRPSCIRSSPSSSQGSAPPTSSGSPSTHRVRSGHPEPRPDLPAQRGPRCDASPHRRQRTRQGRPSPSDRPDRSTARPPGTGWSTVGAHGPPVGGRACVTPGWSGGRRGGHDDSSTTRVSVDTPATTSAGVQPRSTLKIRVVIPTMMRPGAPSPPG